MGPQGRTRGRLGGRAPLPAVPVPQLRHCMPGPQRHPPGAAHGPLAGSPLPPSCPPSLSHFFCVGGHVVLTTAWIVAYLHVQRSQGWPPIRCNPAQPPQPARRGGGERPLSRGPAARLACHRPACTQTGMHAATERRGPLPRSLSLRRPCMRRCRAAAWPLARRFKTLNTHDSQDQGAAGLWLGQQLLKRHVQIHQKLVKRSVCRK